ncbi:MAG: hypothetical protein KDA58_12615, partial [Planctomycetaceae bacterium]|nr:hypothetical protein [Planctomycetaceae bacterium]
MNSVKRTAFLLLCLCLLTTTVLAQPGGRGGRDRRGFGGPFGGPPGGPGGGPPIFGGPGRGSSLAREIRSSDVQAELKLSDDQLKQLEELGDNRDQMRERMGPLFDKLRSAESDEERQQLQAEMQKIGQEIQEENDGKVRKILGEQQVGRLQQIVLQRSGPRALLQDDVRKDLNISDAQQKQLEEVATAYDTARGELGFRSSEEEREKLRAEYDEKFQAVLSAEQRTQWSQKLGTPLTRGDQRAPTTTAAPATVATTAIDGRPQFYEVVPEGAQVIASFGTAPRRIMLAANTVPVATPDNTTPPAVSNPSAAENAVGSTEAAVPELRFNFQYAPWPDVLKLFAEVSGLTLDLNEVPPGTFSYNDQNTYTPTEALDILNGYLLQRGYVLIRRNEFLVCLNIDHGIPPNLIPNVPVSQLSQHGNNELITVVFPVAGLDVDLIANEVDQLKGPQGKVVGLKTSQAIMVTDIGSNLRRVQTLLETMAAAAGPLDKTFQSYTLKHISTDEAEEIIRVMLNAQLAATNVSAAYDRRDSRSSSSSSNSASPTIAADPRTNTLLIAATMAEHAIVKETLTTIDVDADAANAAVSSRKPYLQVYTVEGADAREVTKTIDALMPGIVVNEDGHNGKVHILATQKQHEEVAQLIRQMSGMGGGMSQVAVVPLTRMDPLVAAATLRAMFVADGDLAPTIEADLLSRQVMIRGTAEQVTQVKMLLAQLGEDGTGQREGSDTLIRSFPLSGRDPSELLPVIERMWNSTTPAPIRIVTPENRGPIREIKEPGGNTGAVREPRAPSLPPVQPASQPAAPNVPTQDSARMPQAVPFPPTFTTQADAPRDELDDAIDQFIGDPAPAQPQSPATASDAPVTITILGDDLVIASPDAEALNRLEELIESTMRVVPPSTAWTVFPLQSADATTTASMLEQLIPDANVSVVSSDSGTFGGMMGGIQDLGSSMLDVAGISSLGGSSGLRIVPEPTLNALMVSGPKYKVAEVQEWLNVLDASEWPGTLR